MPRAIEDNGPIQSYCKHLILKNCRIIDNHGIKVSGIYLIWLAKATLQNCVVADNVNFDPGYETKAWDAYNGGWGRTFTNPYTGQRKFWLVCGALYSHGTGFTLNNCTVANNVNESDPARIVYGAIMLDAGSFTITSSIMWGNGDEVYAQDCASDGRSLDLTSVSYSDIEYTGFIEMGSVDGVISSAPLFIEGTYLIGDGSPCIGTGQGDVDMGAILQ